MKQKAPVARGFLFFWAPIALAATILVAYGAGLPGFLVLDDWGNLEKLASSSSSSLLDLLRASIANESGALRRPVANFTFAVNLATSGFDPLLLKLTNILLHVAASLAVYELSHRVLSLNHESPNTDRVRLTAFVTAAIWALHPIQVSTVLYVVQRMAILSALFSILALITLLAKRENRSTWTTALGFFFLISLSVASKENGALTPVLAGCIILFSQKSVGTPALRAICVGVPIAVGITSTLAFWETIVAGYASREFTLTQRMMTQPLVLAGYMADILFPAPWRLSFFRDDIAIQEINSGTAWIALAALVTLVTAAITLRNRFRLLGFSIAWFLSCHAMESTIIPLEMAFEHRNYLALLGPALFAADRLVALASASRGNPRWTAVAITPLLFLALLTVERALIWADEASFASRETRNSPDSLRANNFAAMVERNNGDTTSPLARMRRMQHLYPTSFFAWAFEMEAACDLGTGIKVPWDRIAENALRASSSDEVLGYFNHIAVKVADDRCLGITMSELDANLNEIGKAMASKGDLRAKQYIWVLRASLQQELDPNAARRILHEALDLQDSIDLRLRIAIFEVELDNMTEAKKILDTVRSKINPLDPRYSLLQALTSRASGNGEGQ